MERASGIIIVIGINNDDKNSEHLEASMMGYFTFNDSTITTRTNNVTS